MSDSMDIEQLDLFEATFSPQRTDDLKSGVAEYIGWRGIWEAMWIIEDGPYEGQWAMSIYDCDKQLGKAPPFSWTPECDLQYMQVYTDIVSPALVQQYREVVMGE